MLAVRSSRRDRLIAGEYLESVSFNKRRIYVGSGLTYLTLLTLDLSSPIPGSAASPRENGAADKVIKKEHSHSPHSSNSSTPKQHKDLGQAGASAAPITNGEKSTTPKPATPTSQSNGMHSSHSRVDLSLPLPLSLARRKSGCPEEQNNTKCYVLRGKHRSRGSKVILPSPSGGPGTPGPAGSSGLAKPALAGPPKGPASLGPPYPYPLHGGAPPGSHGLPADLSAYPQGEHRLDFRARESRGKASSPRETGEPCREFGSSISSAFSFCSQGCCTTICLQR